MEEKIIGWFQGRMEFGPRALGGRSIIGDSHLRKYPNPNESEYKIPRILSAICSKRFGRKTAEYFDLKVPSPYMLLVAPVKKKLGHHYQQKIKKL